MLNYKPTLLENLNELGYPVLAETALASWNTFPCITYNLNNDLVRANGNTFGYSDVYYNIKVWGHKMSEMEPIALEVDDLMRELGFKRISVNELWFEGLGQKELRYQGLGRERFN